MIEPEKFLQDLFQAGITAADPLKCVPPHLPKPPKGRTIVIGAGKASAMMAKAVEKNWHEQNRQGDISGLVVTRYDYGVETDHIKIVEAAHPIPDEAGLQAAQDILDLVSDLKPDDLVIALISGGGSALLSLPLPGISFAEKQEINKALLRSGSAIDEMNCVRKHLSAIKGGQLAKAVAPARLVTLLISDVPGDDPTVIASGPTLPDSTTQKQALTILNKYNISISDAIRSILENSTYETPKAGASYFSGNEVHITAKAQDMLEVAAAYARSQDILPIILGDAIEGEAKVIGAEHAQIARSHLNKAPCVILSGGETTVTIKGNGRGGRNSEYLLSCMIACDGHDKLYGIACDSDGIDGSENNAGAFFTPGTLQKALDNGLTPAAYLEDNNAYSFFDDVGSLVITGPTYTNVNDFRALLILP